MTRTRSLLQYKGFTLIELLVATAAAAIIFMVLIMLVSTSTQFKRQAEGQVRTGRDVAQVLGMMRRELEGAYAVGKTLESDDPDRFIVDNTADWNRLCFWTSVDNRLEPSDSMEDVRIRYHLVNEQLLRDEQRVSDTKQIPSDEITEYLVLKGVTGFRIEWWDGSDPPVDTDWFSLEQVMPERLSPPRRLRITLTVKDSKLPDAAEREYREIIDLPNGGA